MYWKWCVVVTHHNFLFIILFCYFYFQILPISHIRSFLEPLPEVKSLLKKIRTSSCSEKEANFNSFYVAGCVSCSFYSQLYFSFLFLFNYNSFLHSAVVRIKSWYWSWWRDHNWWPAESFVWAKWIAGEWWSS